MNDNGKKLGRWVARLALLAGCVFVLLSLVSFAPADWPNPYFWPHAQPPHNFCGRAGAFIAYHLRHAIGRAGYLLALFVLGSVLTVLKGRRVTDVGIRGVGLALLVVTAATCENMLLGSSSRAIPPGEGGVIGVVTAAVLRKNLSAVGSAVILLFAGATGLLLAADSVVLAMGRLPGVALRRLRNLPRPRASRSRGVRSGRVEPQPVPAAVVTGTVQGEELFDAVDATERERPAPAGGEVSDDSESHGRDGRERLPSRDERARSAVAAPVVAPKSSPPPPPRQQLGDYQPPPLDLLEDADHSYSAVQERLVREKAAILEKTLHEFNVEARVVEIETGPVITLFELELAPGVKVSQVVTLSNDIARALSAQTVRVVAPIPGKHTIGVEVPNAEKEKVRLKELIQLCGEKPNRMFIPLFLGKDASGRPLLADLTAMPHLLIAGTTGSGKSVCLNAIILSVLMTQRPDMVKLIMIDPKMVEMAAFKDVPHLMCPIVTEPRRAEHILEWACTQMEERYALLHEAGVRNIAEYNRLGEEELMKRFLPASEDEKVRIPVHLPYVIIIVDELADLMMNAAKEVEAFVVRLAQKSRAVGIHIVLATQRPQATVVTGLIKSNLPTRISFRVAAKMDSRIVLDQNGAETLLGAGDMLFLQPGTAKLIRAQGTFISDKEIRQVVAHLTRLAEPQYHPELIQLHSSSAEDLSQRDELFDEAVRIVLETQRGSVSLLQRRLTIGYGRASRLIDQMAEAGIVGPYKGSQAREVLMTLEEWESLRSQVAAETAEGMTD